MSPCIGPKFPLLIGFQGLTWIIFGSSGLEWDHELGVCVVCWLTWPQEPFSIGYRDCHMSWQGLLSPVGEAVILANALES